MAGHEGSRPGAGPAPQTLTPSPGRRRAGLAALGAASLAALVSHVSHPTARALTLDVRPVTLLASDPSRTTVGPLTFRGGIWLRAEDLAFGGLSGLLVSPDGARLLAVSDCGRVFAATLTYDAGGRLVGLIDAELGTLAGPGGRPLRRKEIDAEGLAPIGNGRVLVSFEGRPPRLGSYALGDGLAGPEESPVGPSFGDDCVGNKGPEAVARSPTGDVIVLCEGSGLRPDSATFWQRRKGRWVPRRYPLASDEPGLKDVYRPTGAAFLADGDLLVLERRFPPLSARLVRLPAADLEGEGPLSPHEVVRLEPPLTVDNFEGLALRQSDSGTTLLYLVSDDNGCSKGLGLVAPRLQRTLLMMFELK